jgi:signal-transduction protein with cAMP-binding, CBS, and nucleotidyltransferase domain
MERIDFDKFIESIALQDMLRGSVFGALSEQAVHFLLERGELYGVKAGDTVFEYGDASDCFYVVCKGSLDFFKQHDDKLRHIRVVNFGEETGFVPMIALHKQSGSAIAREDSIVLQVSSILYAELHQEFALDFGLLTLNLAREMARVIDKMGEALVEDAVSRKQG